MMSKRLFNRLNKFVLFSLIFSLAFFISTLSASAVTYTVPQTAEVKVSWDHNDPLPEGYRVYQRKSGQVYDYSNPVWTGANNIGAVYNLEYDTTYYFVVRAFEGTLESVDSDEVSFMAPTPAPATYSISATASGSGVISPAGVTTATEGADQNYTITPDSGYQIADVSVDGISRGALTAYTFSAVDGDHTIAARFEAVAVVVFDGGITDSGSHISDGAPAELVIDDGDSGTSFSGKWSTSGGVNPYGTQALYSKEVGATYSYESAISGTYDIEMWWTEYPSRCTDVPVRIYDGNTLLETVIVNQQQDGGQWNFLGIYEFTTQARVVITSENSSCSTSADTVRFVKSAEVVSEEVIDDGAAGTSFSGKWSTSGGVNPYGTQSLYSKEVGATYSYESAISGTYDIEMWWTEYPSRCTDVPVRIYDGNTLLETVIVNQQQNGGQWNLLGVYKFTTQARVVITSEDSSFSTSADAVRFVKSAEVVSEEVIDDGAAGTSFSGKWSTSGGVNPYGTQSLYSKEVGATYSYESAISGTYEVEMWWTEYPSRCTDVPVRIYDGNTLLETVIVNQQQDGGQWNLLGAYKFTTQARVVITSDDRSFSTSADAVRFVKSTEVVSEEVIDDGAAGTSSSGKWSVSGGANPYGTQSLYSKEVGATYSYESTISGTYEVEMWWTEYPSRCTDVPVRIYDGNTLLKTVIVNQQQDGGRWNSLGAYKFTTQARVVITSDDRSFSTSVDAIRYLKK